MAKQQAQLSDFEGLIFSTAVRYAPILDEDVEDIQQILRVKVWQALERYEATRSSLDVERFVFGCVYNRVKDLLKSQSRRNDARSGRQLYIEDETDATFEARHLRVEAEVAFAVVEDERIELPSTLTAFEKTVVLLLVAGFNQTEVCGHLQASAKRVRQARASVQQKMLDWKPDAYEEARTPVAA